MSFSIYNTTASNVIVTVTDSTTTETITDYFAKIYKSPFSSPSIRDITFVWSHILGNLDNWAKNGLAGEIPEFRWNNQPLPSPTFDFPTPVGASDLVLYNRKQANNIADTLPRENIIWTPDWFTYPQTAVNRYNPKAWNQFFFNYLGVGPLETYSNVQDNVTFEVSNTGGPAPNGDGTQTFFFYYANGSGIRFTPPKVMFALNKIHAYYVYQCFLQDAAAAAAGTLTTVQLDAAFAAVFTALNDAAVTPALIDQMENALTIQSGYFAIPSTSTVVDDLLWTPIQTAYPIGAAGVPGAVIEPKLFATICYSIGMLPFTVTFTAPQPNILNANCNASNAYAGLLGANVSNIATNAYEYLVQVATNLTVLNNVLDPFVNQILASGLNIDAVANLSQWNALGGFTAEIPSYLGDITTGTKPSLSTTNGCTLQEEWWTGEGGILGINDYTATCADFTIPSDLL